MSRVLPIFFIVTILGASCVKEYEDVPEEDYETLFPFTGIEKNDEDDGEIIIKDGNPDLNISTFDYANYSKDDVIRSTKYDITLTYRFDEGDMQNNTYSKSKIFVGFVNSDKYLRGVTSEDFNAFIPEEELQFMEEHNLEPLDLEMESGKDYSYSFKAQSGFPLYLSVRGMGVRGAKIQASITAIANNGLIEPIRLNTTISQNKEGPNPLTPPYCKYVILP